MFVPMDDGGERYWQFGDVAGDLRFAAEKFLDEGIIATVNAVFSDGPQGMCLVGHRRLAAVATAARRLGWTADACIVEALRDRL